jgi:putative Holliday junction resolvase
MAFDYGTKRIGIAVTDPLQLIATALTTVHPNEIFEYLKKYMESEPVERFIVGQPLQLDGSDSKSASHVLGFTRSLKKHFPSIDVVTIDERYTSKMASAVIAQSDLRRSKRQDKKLIDRVSAVIILQSYMDSQQFIK